MLYFFLYLDPADAYKNEGKKRKKWKHKYVWDWYLLFRLISTTKPPACFQKDSCIDKSLKITKNT